MSGSYLITGGLSGLGLEVGQRLYQRGVKNLILVGRSKYSNEAKAIVSEMEKGGAKVKVSLLDIADSGAVEKLLSEISVEMPKLKGIIHAAGVLSDARIGEQDWDKYVKVMSPKIFGAWNLHQQTARMELDLFVMFSSVTSVLGNAGQANYGGANAFMDALAYQRRQQGLSAVSMNWGPWAEAGMAAGMNEREREALIESGLSLIPKKEGLDTFDQVVSSHLRQVMVEPVIWEKFAKAWPAGQGINFLSEFVDFESLQQEILHEEEKVEEVSELLALMNNSTAESKRSAVMEYLNKELAEILGIKGALDPRKGFMAMGVDSLLAISFKNKLKQQVGRQSQKIPATLLFDYPTLEDLTNFIVKEIVTSKTDTMKTDTVETSVSGLSQKGANCLIE